MMLVKLHQNMSADQRQLIECAEFAGLMNCGFSQIFPAQSQWILDHFNAEACALVFPGRGVIPITESRVNHVLGVPMGSRTIKCEMDSKSTSFILAQLGLSKGKQPKLSDVYKMLQQNACADVTYLRTWILFPACSVVFPTFSTRLSPRLYPALLDTGAIGQHNWCELVIRVLKNFQKPDFKLPFKPCLTFLMVIPCCITSCILGVLLCLLSTFVHFLDTVLGFLGNWVQNSKKRLPTLCLVKCSGAQGNRKRHQR